MKSGIAVLVSAIALLAGGPASAQITWTQPRHFGDPFNSFHPGWEHVQGGGYTGQDFASVLHDLDGDGDLDVILPLALTVSTTLGPPTPMYFLENDGQGNLVRNDAKFLDGAFPGMKTYRQICMTDVNRDGRLDMFLESTGYEGDPATWAGERNRLLLAQPDGRMKDVTDTNMPAHSAFSHQGSCQDDFTGDGAPDYYENTLAQPWADSLWFNDGSGRYTVVADLGSSFRPDQRLVGTNAYIEPDRYLCFDGPYVTAPLKPAPWRPADIYWGQIRNLQNPGLSQCPTGLPNYLQVMLMNDGTGHFTFDWTRLPPRPWPKTSDLDGAEANNLKVADLDDDGDDDLILLMNPNADSGLTQAIYLLRQQPNVQFTDERLPDLQGPGGGAVFVADINGDGAPDLYTQKPGANFQGVTPQVWLNDGYGQFTQATEVGGGAFNPGAVFAVGDLDGDGWAELLGSITNFIPGKSGPALVSTSLRGPAPARIVGAVAPLNRSVQTGQTATAFATIVNATDKPLKGCRIQAPRTRASTFSYQATNPATNLPIGQPNTEIDVPASGVQSFVFAVSVTGQTTGEDLQIELDCRNTRDAERIDGLSLFRLSSSATATPDIVPIAVTPSADAVMRLNQGGMNGFFAAAAVNIGAAGQVTVKPVATSAIPATLSICETGAGLSPPAAQVEASFGANQTRTFSVFGSASTAIAPDFARKRVLLDFNAPGGALLGRASVAVTTAAP